MLGAQIMGDDPSSQLRLGGSPDSGRAAAFVQECLWLLNMDQRVQEGSSVAHFMWISLGRATLLHAWSVMAPKYPGALRAKQASFGAGDIPVSWGFHVPYAQLPHPFSHG